ncbi:hypothetical protein EYF80_022712 [Liparis tanakae]|uniref:Uncharacterized protein n=1 Tax=Liparis tanakae TaxID=230148 RepID=A0A4Z2HMJ0_9TELE|nr:hypothetical protein EYF80_022712 [Liparis tanakae]
MFPLSDFTIDAARKTSAGCLSCIAHADGNSSPEHIVVRKQHRHLQSSSWLVGHDRESLSLMIKGKQSSVENRAIIGSLARSLLPLFPREACSPECNEANAPH